MLTRNYLTSTDYVDGSSKNQQTVFQVQTKLRSTLLSQDPALNELCKYNHEPVAKKVWLGSILGTYLSSFGPKYMT